MLIALSFYTGSKRVKKFFWDFKYGIRLVVNFSINSYIIIVLAHSSHFPRQLPLLLFQIFSKLLKIFFYFSFCQNFRTDFSHIFLKYLPSYVPTNFFLFSRCINFLTSKITTVVAVTIFYFLIRPFGIFFSP